MTIVLGSNLIVPGGGDSHTKYTDAEAIAAVEGEATLALAGDVDVATGKILSADGLLFPDTQVASADANALDDYEEGTWTPAIADSDLDGSGEGQTYTTQFGRYVKIGNMVYVSFQLRVSSIGTLTGGSNAFLVGLPFTSTNDSNYRTAFVLSFATGLAITAGSSVSLSLGGNSVSPGLQVWDATTGTSTMTITEFSADGRIAGFGVYGV